MEVNLVDGLLPRSDRSARLERRKRLTKAERAELGRFGREYFDGPTGYGGYRYDGRYAPVVRAMIERYGLDGAARVLDVGCAKGFTLVEFVRQGITDVRGCDVSEYAVACGHPDVRDRLSVMSADRLDYADASFDLVYSIDVIHNLPPPRCDAAVVEMMRVSRGAVFLQVASYETPEEERRLREWGVTVRTFRSKTQWREAFERLGFAGDYYCKTF
ncbi:MAG: class I SAM-dependent methyltransferase [Planctomycetota bacterium]|nr:MAG: class I SAM-dependent methyltransferase [Planctomycetota bacterium]